MRLTVNLDDDLYRMAKAFAQAEDISVSKAVNLILRRATLAHGSGDPLLGEVLSDFPVSRCRQQFSNEDVHRVEDGVELTREEP
jgi:hypothetical protein